MLISGAGQNFTLVIHDASGKTLLSTQETVVNLSHLAPGIYFLRLEGNSGHRTQKLIKH
ncbi:MAG: T9SS type A sorting domain-containing protein [Flavobacteriales bacterium]